MKPPAGGIAIGINGVNIFKDALYFTNSFANTFNSVSVNSDGTPSGAAQTIAVCEFVCDDFTIDEDGNAFVAHNPGNMLRKITPDRLLQGV
jgi:sugar lactone lactonase YvrE